MSSASTLVEIEDSDNDSISSVTCSYNKTYCDTSSDESYVAVDAQELPDEELQQTHPIEDSHDTEDSFGPQEINRYLKEEHPMQFQRLTDFLKEREEENLYTHTSRNLGKELGCYDKVPPADVLFDICIFTSTYAPLLLTFVKGEGKRRKNIEYNAGLVRRIILAVREDTLTNFSMIYGVIEQEICQSQERFSKAIIEMETKAYSLSLPRSLDMCETRLQRLKLEFQKMLSVKNAVKTPGPMDMSVTTKGEMCPGPINILLIGESGSGKSSIANTLLGRRQFRTGLHSRDETESWQMSSVTEGQKTYHVFDTRSLLNKDSDTKQTETCLKMCRSSTYVVLFVISIMQITTDVKTLFKRLTLTFGQEILRYTVVVITGKDNLDADGISLEDVKSDKRHRALRELIDKCHGHYVLVSNREDVGKRTDVQSQILNYVDDLIHQNMEHGLKEHAASSHTVEHPSPIVNGHASLLSQGLDKLKPAFEIMNSHRDKVRNFTMNVAND